jgi:outer membrane protein assembly factor BamB
MKAFIHNCRPKLLLPIALLGLAAPGWSATDFAQWRGPLRDGHSPETGLLQAWPKDGPKLLWQVTNVTEGFSTPSVVGDRIYLLGSEGAEESVYALSGKDGSRVWAAKLGKVGHPEQKPSYPGARSTPTVDDKFLFALGSDGDLVCLDSANGKEVWHKHLRTDFGGNYGEWAYSESPLVDGDKLIVTPGGTNATMVALNKKTGEPVWKCAVPEGSAAGYASMITAEFSGVKQYVQFLTSGLMGIDPGTGKLLWRYEKPGKGSPAVIITPLVSGGMVYSGAFRATTALIKPMLKEGAFTVEEIYSNGKLPVGLGGVVKVGDYFYGSGSTAAMCVEFKTGVVKWEERSIGAGSLLVADQRIYVHAESGDVALFEPSAEGYREQGRFTPPGVPSRANPMEKAWTYPVIANGKLYIRDKQSLWCYDVKAGK